MKVADRTLAKLFVLVEPELAAVLSFDTIQKKYESILETIGTEEDKAAVSYVLWQLFQERRWTPHLLSRLVVIYLLYVNGHRLPEEGRDKMIRAFLQAYLGTSSDFEEQERILMARLVLNEGKLSANTLCRKLDDGLNLEQIGYKDNDRLVTTYERVQKKLADRHCLDRAKFPCVVASKMLNSSILRSHAEFSRTRRAYFAKISCEDGPIFRTFTPEVIQISPGVLSVTREIGILVPGIFDFPYLLWDNTLDDLICDVPESKGLLALAAERPLELDEHRDLIGWITQVLGPIDKQRLAFREPQRLRRFGFSAGLLIRIADRNPQAAVDILKHAIHQYDMAWFVHKLICSFECPSQIADDEHSDTSLLVNRFDTIVQLLQFADMPVEYVQLFLINSLDACERHPDLCGKLGRKLCLLVLRIMDDDDSTKAERAAVKNICNYIESFCVQLRGVEEAIAVYTRIRSFSEKTTASQKEAAAAAEPEEQPSEGHECADDPASESETIQAAAAGEGEAAEARAGSPEEAKCRKKKSRKKRSKR